MKKYNVIEERGCNIEYVVFFGSDDECAEYVANILDAQDTEKDLPLEERCLYNGNGEPFTYRIEEDNEIHWVLCSDVLLDTCIASSLDEATEIFKQRGSCDNWDECNILCELDYKNDIELRTFEAENF